MPKSNEILKHGGIEIEMVRWLGHKKQVVGEGISGERGWGKWGRTSEGSFDKHQGGGIAGKGARELLEARKRLRER